MAGWHHWLNGCESEWTLGVGDGQGGLACCSSWGRKELDTAEQLNWTEQTDGNGCQLDLSANHFTIYTSIESLCCTPEIYIMFYVNLPQFEKRSTILKNHILGKLLKALNTQYDNIWFNHQCLWQGTWSYFRDEKTEVRRDKITELILYDWSMGEPRFKSVRDWPPY